MANGIPDTSYQGLESRRAARTSPATVAQPSQPTTGAVEKLVSPSAPATTNPFAQMMAMRPFSADEAEFRKVASEFHKQEALTELAKEQAKGRAERKVYEGLKSAGLTSEQIEQKQKEAMTRIGEEPVPEPTRENIKDFAGMFSVLSALSFAVGGKGRGAGMAGLAALNGAMEGWNKGQKDLFSKNMKLFEKQLASYKARQERELKLLDQIYQLRASKTEEGRMLIQEFIAEDQGYAAERLKLGDLKGTYESKKASYQGAIAAEKMLQSVMARSLAKQMTAGTGVKLKMTADPQKRLTSARDSLNSINEIETLLKDPRVAKEFDSRRLIRTLLESPNQSFPIEKYIKQSLYQNLSPDTQKLFTLIATARNDYFKTMSGTAVSGSEGARNFFASIDPSDKSQTLLNKAATIKPKFVRQLAEIKDGYELPQPVIANLESLIARNTLTPSGLPKTHTDAAGNTYILNESTGKYRLAKPASEQE